MICLIITPPQNLGIYGPIPAEIYVISYVSENTGVPNILVQEQCNTI